MWIMWEVSGSQIRNCIGFIWVLYAKNIKFPLDLTGLNNLHHDCLLLLLVSSVRFVKKAVEGTQRAVTRGRRADSRG